MNQEYIIHLKNKLAAKFKTLENVDEVNFERKLKYFWNFINSEILFKSILDSLEKEIDDEIKESYNNVILPPNPNTVTFDQIYFEDEFRGIVFAYYIFKKYLGYKDQRQNQYGLIFSPNSVEDDNHKKFRLKRLNLFVEYNIFPVYNYLEENLDQNKFILGILKRYKYKCEWFSNDYLHDKISSKENSRIEEQVLAPHLYEYLHDQGLDNLYEIKSGLNGRTDFRSNLSKGYEFIGEVKIYKNGTTQVLVGFKELIRYLDSNSFNIGYLIIFNIHASKTLQTTPIFKFNDKTIYTLTVDIRKSKQTPSDSKEKVEFITQENVLSYLSKTKK